MLPAVVRAVVALASRPAEGHLRLPPGEISGPAICNALDRGIAFIVRLRRPPREGACESWLAQFRGGLFRGI